MSPVAVRLLLAGAATMVMSSCGDGGSTVAVEPDAEVSTEQESVDTTTSTSTSTTTTTTTTTEAPPPDVDPVARLEEVCESVPEPPGSYELFRGVRNVYLGDDAYEISDFDALGVCSTIMASRWVYDPFTPIRDYAEVFIQAAVYSNADQAEANLPLIAWTYAVNRGYRLVEAIPGFQDFSIFNGGYPDGLDEYGYIDPQGMAHAFAIDDVVYVVSGRFDDLSDVMADLIRGHRDPGDDPPLEYYPQPLGDFLDDGNLYWLCLLLDVEGIDVSANPGADSINPAVWDFARDQFVDDEPEISAADFEALVPLLPPYVQACDIAIAHWDWYFATEPQCCI